MRSVAMYQEALSKGAGARGGKVIGTTRSGKPIYMRHARLYGDKFSEKDHQDAHAAHVKAAQDIQDKIKARKESGSTSRHASARVAAGNHKDLAESHMDRVKNP